MMKKPKTPEAPTHIGDLHPNPANARTHSPQSVGMIADAMHAVGAARSIVIDECDEILAGHGTVDAASQVGITKLLVVEADGNTLVAVRRRGLTDAQKVHLALADNRSTERSSWNIDVLKQLQTDEVDLSPFWSEEELVALFNPEPDPASGAQPASCICPTCGTKHKAKY